MASKSIEWDEILVTKDPKKKEVGVTFVKVDGFGSPGGGSGGGTCPPGTFKHYSDSLSKNGGFELITQPNTRITDVDYPDFIDTDFFIYVSREEARPFDEWVDVSFEPREGSGFPWTIDTLPEPVKVLIPKGQVDGKLKVTMPAAAKWSENQELYPDNDAGLYYLFDMVIDSPACDSRPLILNSPCTEDTYVLPPVETQGRRPFLLLIDICGDDFPEGDGGNAGPPVPGDNDECLAHDCDAFEEVSLGGLLVGYVQGAPLWEDETVTEGYGTVKKLISPNNGVATGIAAFQEYWVSESFNYKNSYFWSAAHPDNGGAGIICNAPSIFGPTWGGTQTTALCPAEVFDLTNNLEDWFWPESNTIASNASPFDYSVYPFVGQGEQLSSSIKFSQTIVISPEGATAPGPTSKNSTILCRTNPMSFSYRADFNNAGTYPIGGGFSWTEGDIQLIFYGDGRITYKKRVPSNTVGGASTVSDEISAGTWDPNLVGVPITVTMVYEQQTSLSQTTRNGLFKLGVSTRQGANSATAVNEYTCSRTAPDYSGSNGEAFVFPSFKAMTPATGLGWNPLQARCGFVYTSTSAVPGDFGMRVLAAVGGSSVNTSALSKLLRSFTTYQSPTYCERIP